MGKRNNPVSNLWARYDHEWNRILEAMTGELHAALAAAEEERRASQSDTPVHDLFGPKAHAIMNKYGVGWKQS
jgi:hypothetical protein